MGFWDWLFGRHQSTSKSASSNRPAARTRRGRQEDGGVAVMDPPSTPRASSEMQNWWVPTEGGVTDWIPPERPELTPVARGFENLLISHFDGRDVSLPPLLNGAERVLPILGDPDCTINTLANAIAADQVVAAAVLRMANSPLYRGVNKITALQPAISRLGTRAIRMLLVHESLRAATFRQGDDRLELARMVWRRSLASGCVMRGLAKFTGLDREEAFLAGLLHDVGNVVVLRIANDDKSLKRAAVDLDLDTFEYLCYVTHQELGELVADAWSLPPTIKEVVASHHTPPAEDDALRSTRLMVQATDMINALLGYAEYVPYDLMQARPVLALGLSGRPDFVTFLEELPPFLDEAVSTL